MQIKKLYIFHTDYTHTHTHTMLTHFKDCSNGAWLGVEFRVHLFQKERELNKPEN